ncbi:MAG: PAS domain S-box protein [Anaerolineae bacterium]
MPSRQKSDATQDPAPGVAEAEHESEKPRPPCHAPENSEPRLAQAAREAEYANSVLSTLIDTLPVGVVVADAEGRVLLTNHIGKDILKGPVLGRVDQLQGSYRAFHTNGTPLSPGQTPLALAVDQGIASRDIEIVLRFNDGTQTILSVDATPLVVEGKLSGGVMTFRDITEHKQRERAHQRLLTELRAEHSRAESLTQTLRRERDILDAIMENTQTHLAYLDTDFNFVKVNVAYAQGAGKTVEELIGRNHFELFPNAKNQAVFERVRDTGKPVSFEAKPFVYPERPELGVTYWDWTLVPVKDEDGNVIGLAFSLLDVTRRQRATAQMASLARFPAENPHPVLRIKEDGTLVYANEGSSPLLETWGIEVGEKVPLRWRARVREAIRGQKSSSAEVRAKNAIYTLTVAPSLEGHANLYGLDITDLRRTQRSLRQHAGRLRALHHIDQAILTAQSVEAIAEAALARLPQLIDCVRASVMVFDFESEEATLLAVYTVTGETQVGGGWRAPIPDELYSQMDQLRQGQSVITEDVHILDPTSPLIVAMQAEGVHTLLQQPLQAQGDLIGVLRLGLHQPGRVSPRSIELARELADQLAIAIQQARLHRQIQEHAQELEQRVIWRTAALRISEARFRAIFEDAPVGIALLDQEGRIIQSNSALEMILGTGAMALRDRTLSSFMIEKDAARETELYSELMDGSREGYRVEARFLRQDHETVWCNVAVSLVRDAEYEPRLAIGMVEDITEERVAQAAMVQTEKLALTGQLAASLAHEINNPLQTVIGCLGLADETVGEDANVRVYLDMASAELKRAASIVGRLRDLNRPSEPEEKEIKPLWELVDHVLAVTEKQCRDNHIVVRTEQRDGYDPQVEVVPNRIHQVFLNLILNAIDAMPKGGELTIRCDQKDDPRLVSLTFSDTGMGIAPETQARLFDPFHTTKSDGLGLGLFISQNIIEDHGGQIHVESHPGEGTAFTVRLPKVT